MPQNSKMLIGAVIAAALAFAVYYGLISQQSASTIQTQANQTLGTAPSTQQPAPSVPQTTTQVPTTPAPAPATQTPAQTPKP